MALARPTQLQGVTDLTLIAEIKPGLIEGILESRTYAWRLGRVLELLDAVRRNYREAEALPNPFIDAVARLRVVHFFRFAILPPGDRLLLNVTFDGGWEPYMRQIWGPLGTMLDLIFCHCPDYPLAACSSYDQYTRWIRQREVPSQFFYADSGGSVADREYLNRLEALQRCTGGQAMADQRAAQLALGPAKPPQPVPAAVAIAVRTLKGIHGIKRWFGTPPPAGPRGEPPPDDDASVLLRFAQDFLPDLRDWIAQGLFDPGQRYDALRRLIELERSWLMAPRWSRAVSPAPPSRPEPQALQAGILASPKAPDGRYGRGALVLARVSDPLAAHAWLQASAAPAPQGAFALISDGRTLNLTDDRVACTVAITYEGLKALRIHADHLGELPAEFVQGMEARAGILGDLGANHPQQWERPRAWPLGPCSPLVPIDLALVHLVFQLRTCEAGQELPPDGDRSALLPRLEQWIVANLRLPALEVLAVEPAWSRPGAPTEPAPRDHFGYADGVSQPSLTPSGPSLYWDDSVKAGELLLGCANDRGDGPGPAGAWWEMGSFLVVRKIRQFVAQFDAAVEKAALTLMTEKAVDTMEQARELVRAKLMGRGSDGKPLMLPTGPGVNDFDYRHDAEGGRCPFASHVRRANPRVVAQGARPPRIMRRGMAYGPPADRPNAKGRDADQRGLLFLAYNASIAEQFEVIQRWLAGGNSSGVSSSQPDPFVGVPRVGEPGIFRFVHNDKVFRVDLGDQPVSRLEWGLYAFVPSMALLQGLHLWLQPKALAAPPAPRAYGPSAVPVDPFRIEVKRAFEDEAVRKASWDRVHEEGGVKRIGSTVVVGAYEPLMQVLRDRGVAYSASGYGERMRATLGGSPFGRDEVEPDPGHARSFVADVKNAIVGAVTEAQAFDVAYAITALELNQRLKAALALGQVHASVDIVELGLVLVAELCRKWFGVVPMGSSVVVGGPEGPEGQIRCPGHFLSVARYVFSAYPNQQVEDMARIQGEELKVRVPQWVADAPADAPAEAPVDAPADAPADAAVLKAVLGAIARARQRGEPVSDGDSNDDGNGTVANTMLGLPATLLGSWTKVLIQWIGDRRLWRLQHAPALRPGSTSGHASVADALRAELIDTMAVDPVADGIWRKATQSHMCRGVEVNQGDVVWLGLGAALRQRSGDRQAAEDLLFGGSMSAASDRYTPHACPGRGLAIGALLGGLAALLAAGRLARTPSPTVLSLMPPRP